MKRKKAFLLISSVIFSVIFHIIVASMLFYLLKEAVNSKNKLPPLPKETVVDIVTLPKKKKPKITVKEKHKVASNISRKGRAKVFSKKEKLPFGTNKKAAMGIVIKPEKTKKTTKVVKAGRPKEVAKQKKKPIKEKETKKLAKSEKKTKIVVKTGLKKHKISERKAKTQVTNRQKKEQVVKIPGGIFSQPKTYPGFTSGKSLQYEYKNAKREATISISTQSIKYASYLEHIKNKIQNVWVYPIEAARTGQQGKLLVLFSIDKSGDLVRLKLIRSSGYPLLDNAALEAIRDASPFPPLPRRFHLDVLNIYATFEYELGFNFIQ